MHESDLRVFVEGTMNYFQTTCKRPACVGSPYLVDRDSSVVSEYTGVIGISGKRKGSVYFTAPGDILKDVLEDISENDTSHENMCDLVGEIANTISGNARREFGKEFMISVPVIVSGESPRILNPKGLRSFVVPIEWNHNSCHLVICLE